MATGDDTIWTFAGLPEWSKGPDCKSGGAKFPNDGSNPSPGFAIAKKGGG